MSSIPVTPSTLAPASMTLPDMRSVPVTKVPYPGQNITQIRDGEKNYLAEAWLEAHMHEATTKNTAWKPVKIQDKTKKVERRAASMVEALRDYLKGVVFTYLKPYAAPSHLAKNLPTPLLTKVNLGDNLINHGHHHTIPKDQKGWDDENPRPGCVFWWYSLASDSKIQGYLPSECVTFVPTPEPPRQQTTQELKQLQQEQKVAEKKRKREEKEEAKQQKRRRPGRAVRQQTAYLQSVGHAADAPISIHDDDKDEGIAGLPSQFPTPPPTLPPTPAPFSGPPQAEQHQEREQPPTSSGYLIDFLDDPQQFQPDLNLDQLDPPLDPQANEIMTQYERYAVFDRLDLVPEKLREAYEEICAGVKLQAAFLAAEGYEDPSGEGEYRKFRWIAAD